MFDTKDFYPSIKEKLLWEAIRFTKLYISIGSKKLKQYFIEEITFILQRQNWVKKGEGNFDVSMGAYDGAEICELIDIFMLSLLSKHINKNHIGLYRDNGLAILKNTSCQEAEKLKKKLQKIF